MRATRLDCGVQQTNLLAKLLRIKNHKNINFSRYDVPKWRLWGLALNLTHHSPGQLRWSAVSARRCRETAKAARERRTALPSPGRWLFVSVDFNACVSAPHCGGLAKMRREVSSTIGQIVESSGKQKLAAW